MKHPARRKDGVACSRIVPALVAGCLLLFPVFARAAGTDGDTVVRQAEQAIRAAQNAMFSGKLDEAHQKALEASTLLDEARQKNASETKLRTAQSKLDKLKRDLANRTKKPVSPVAPAAGSAAGTPKADKLPAGVSKRLRDIDRMIQRTEATFAEPTGSYTTSQIEQARYVMSNAHGVMKEIEEKYAGQYAPDAPDVKAVTDRLAALEQRVDAAAAGAEAARAQAAEAQAAQQGASAPWIARLKPYVTGLGQAGYQEEKYLVPSATQDPADMARRLAIYNEAAAELKAYKASEAAADPTDELRDIAAELEDNCTRFNASCQEYLAQDMREAEAEIARQEKFLDEQQAKADAKEFFLPMNRDVATGIARLLDRAAGLAGKDDPRLAELNRRFDALKKRSAKLQAALIANTRMIPDKFQGAELETLKGLAREIVSKANPGIQILRTTVISPAWNEESVIEYTDTTHTALRHRVTQSVSAQVAGKKSDGCFLYTVHLARDRRSDGSWGQLHGHVMFTDPILEENVSK